VRQPLLAVIALVSTESFLAAAIGHHLGPDVAWTFPF
jgi:hypothetical protein